MIKQLSDMTLMHWRQLVARILSAVAMATSPAVAISAQAKEVELAPSSPWNVDWSETACSLRRQFGEPGNRAIIQMERYAPSSKFQLVIVANALKSVNGISNVRLFFGDVEPRESSMLSAMTGETTFDEPKETLASIMFTTASLGKLDKKGDPMEVVSPAMEAASKSITVKWGLSRLTLKTGPLDKAFEVMRQCTDNLLAHWGLDPATQATLQRPLTADNDIRRWVTTSDYPKDMLFKGKQALVVFRLLVNAEGKPTDCKILRSYSDEAFDRVTCTTISSRARFKPALNKDGLPAASYYINSVRFTTF